MTGAVAVAMKAGKIAATDAMTIPGAAQVQTIASGGRILVAVDLLAAVEARTTTRSAGMTAAVVAAVAARVLPTQTRTRALPLTTSLKAVNRLRRQSWRTTVRIRAGRVLAPARIQKPTTSPTTLWTTDAVAAGPVTQSLRNWTNIAVTPLNGRYVS